MSAEFVNGTVMLGHKQSGKKFRRKKTMMVAGISFLILIVCTGVVVGSYFGVRAAPRSASGVIIDDPPCEPSQSVLGVYGKQAVAADSALCSQLGNGILMKNGSAVEAAITTALCSGLVHPHSCGIGGGFFMVAYDRRSGNSTAVDAREVAPLAATELMYVNTSNPGISSVKGWHAAGVPGEIAGYWQAFQMFKSGNLEWKDLFEPVIKMLSEGVMINSVLAGALDGVAKDILDFDDTLKSVFAKNATAVKVQNDTYFNPHLLKTLQIIADDPRGIFEFYHGQIAKDLVQDIKDGGGIITMEDLAQYSVNHGPALRSFLADGSSIYGIPPPAGGLILQYIINIMDGYGYQNKSTASMSKSDQLLFFQRFTEALKHGYARRTEMGDEKFRPEVAQMKDSLLSPWFAKLTRRHITETRTSNDVESYGVKTAPVLGKHGTSHISVLDKNGNAASLTTTINTHFGARKASKLTGIILNNEMDDFAANPTEPNTYGLPPSEANRIQPGKRPVSSCSPTILTDKNGEVRVVIGASGGSRITSATANALVRVLYLGENVKEAIDAPRLHHQLLPMRLDYEPGFDKDIVKGLTDMGHEVFRTATPIAVVQGLVRSDNSSIFANSDYRKKGIPDGL